MRGQEGSASSLLSACVGLVMPVLPVPVRCHQCQGSGGLGLHLVQQMECSMWN